MGKNRKMAIIVGLLILFAYAVLASNVIDSKAVVMLSEVLSGVAVIAIAVLMFPLFKSYDKKVSFWYLLLRCVEGGLMIVGGVLFLLSTSLSLGVRDGIYEFHVYVFVVAALFFYYLFYQSKLIPRFISVWGIIAAILMLLVNLLIMTGSTLTVPMLAIGYAPMILNELFLALWLIIRGFNKKAVKVKKK